MKSVCWKCKHDLRCQNQSAVSLSASSSPEIVSKSNQIIFINKLTHNLIKQNGFNTDNIKRVFVKYVVYERKGIEKAIRLEISLNLW